MTIKVQSKTLFLAMLLVSVAFVQAASGSIDKSSNEV
jgi:hypothetical protein